MKHIAVTFLAIAAIFSLSACATGIVERKVPAKKSDGKCTQCTH